MPRYHFTVIDGGVYEDPIGTELEDVTAAKLAAARDLGQLLLDWPSELTEDGEVELRVSDDRGLTLFNLSVSLTVAPALKG